MNSTVSLAVIIPMFNEERNAENCILKVCNVLQKHVPHMKLSMKLFVVNDGSHDRTGEILENLSRRQSLPLIAVSYDQNKGYGGACLTGAQAAQKAGFEFGLFMDSDLTNDPELIPLFLKKIEKGQYDLVKASRYIKEGGMRGVPWVRQAITICGNKVASVLFNMGIKDCTNGFRAVRLDLICNLKFKERGFPIILEELLYLKQQGARTTEIPYILTSRDETMGKSKFPYSPKVILKYFSYALQASRVSTNE